MARIPVILVAVLLLCARSAWGWEWRLAKLDGRDFVPLENVGAFYQFSGLQVKAKSFSMSKGNGAVQLVGEAGSVEVFIVNKTTRVKINLCFGVREHEGELWISRMDLAKVIDPILRPKEIKLSEPVRTIVLDAGHGGHDKGATSRYGCEKDYTLDVVRRAKKHFEAMGLKVVLTRSDDTFIALPERVRIANQNPNGLFISVHFNSSGKGTGLETYTLAPSGVPSYENDGPRASDKMTSPGNARDAENIALALTSHAGLVNDLRMYDRGIKRARFHVLREIQIPGVLVEGGFLSSGADARMIESAEYREKMALSLRSAVERYQTALSARMNVVSNQGQAEQGRDKGSRSVGKPVGAPAGVDN
jgi:N-acetylmuramoyl-L-alanine amidase